MKEAVNYLSHSFSNEYVGLCVNPSKFVFFNVSKFLK